MAYNWADCVLDCMNMLQSIEELSIPVKNQIQLLKPEVSLLGTLLRCAETECSEDRNLNDLFTRFQVVLHDAGTELHSLCVELSNDNVVADLDRKVSDELEKIKPIKLGIKDVYAVASKLSYSKDPTSDEIVRQFFDCLSANLEDPVNYKAELMVPVKRNIYILEKKLRFFRNFLGFTAKQNVGPDNMKDVFIHVQDLADNAASLSQLCLISETAENMVQGVEPHPSDLQWKIQPIKPEVAESCIEFLKVWRSLKSTTADIPMMTELIVDLLDPLLDDVMELPNFEVSLMVPLKDQIVTLQEDLEFLRILILNLLKTYAKLRKWKHPLGQIEEAASKASSLVCTLSINEMKENVVGEMNVALSDLLEKIKHVKTQVREAYQNKIPKPSASHIPKTDGLSFVDSLIKNLETLQNRYTISSTHVKHQIATVKGELASVRTFFRDVAELRKEHEKLKDLGRRILDAAYKVEHVIELFAPIDYPLPYCVLLLPDIIEEIKPITIEVAEIYDKKMYGIGVDGASMEDVVVGFEDEAEKVIEHLIGGSLPLDVVSIIGMPGLGKTTLAKKVYNHPSISERFYVRAWCCVSQTYQKRDLLLDILGDATEITNQMHTMNEEDLSALLWKHLKGQKYLIIMDDLWDSQAWNDLRRCFPDDKNQSRIIITTRYREVASKAKSGSKLLSLRPFSVDESWELLQEKLFQKKRCPQELLEVGKQIAINCKGLPLAVVLVAGLLRRMEKKEDDWEQIAESLSSYIVGDGDRHCMGILELSYKNLPNHLKPCLLYFGAFPEDREIPVQRLIRLWIAEGYITENEVRSLEDEAEVYLTDLIRRSLVIDAKIRSTDGVKACRIHDLLREFCLAKAKEENFLQLIRGYDKPSSSELFDCELPRLCIYSTRDEFAAWMPPSSQVQALLLFAPSLYLDSLPYYDVSYISESFKLLRVLDLGCMAIDDSFCGIELLVHLRYLAVQLGMNHIPPSIAKLKNLQTFLVKGKRGEVVLPNTIWNMIRLRHMHIHDRATFSLQNTTLEESLLDNLITLSTPSLSYGADAGQIMRRLPALQKLKCIFLESWDSHKNCNRFPVLDFLSQLESLKVFYHGKVLYPCEFSFPSNMRKLTLSKFRLPWSEISTIGRLPNLEVLKLLFRAFEGKQWETRDGEFLNLKFLKLDSLDIEEWDTDRDHFPSLQRLVLQRCKQLQEIPSSLGDIDTLQTIEVQWCSYSAANSAREILKEQEDMGNEELKVLIYPLESYVTSSS